LWDALVGVTCPVGFEVGAETKQNLTATSSNVSKLQLEKFKHDSFSFNMFASEKSHNNKILPSDDGSVKEEQLDSSILTRRQNLIEFDTTDTTHYLINLPNVWRSHASTVSCFERCEGINL
jgi:hypothetical protein